MAIAHRSPNAPQEQNRCAVMFCLTWIGFFVVIGVVTWIGSSL